MTRSPGTVVWIRGESERSMAQARACLTRFQASGPRAGDLRACGAHLHQVTGALQIVGMDGAARFCEEIEQLVRGFEDHHPPPNEEAIRLARRSMDALVQFVNGCAQGRHLPPLLLDPLFREMQRARGVDEPNPSELFYPDLSREPPPHRSSRAVSAGALPVLVAAERGRFQCGLLAWLRGDASGLEAMRDALAAIDGAGLAAHDRTLWWAATAMLEALIDGTLPASNALKKLCGRIDQQMKHFCEGRIFVAEGLLRDVLYQVARAGPGGVLSAVVQDHYGLDALIPTDQGVPFGSLESSEREQLAADARQGLRRAKLAWLSYSTGQSDSLDGFLAHVGELRDRAGRLLNLPLIRLCEAIAETVRALPSADEGRSEELMAEMAGALLVTESALEHADEVDDDLEAQVELISQRLRGAGGASSAQPPLPPVTLLEQRDPRTGRPTPLGDVVREIRANLQHIEQVLDGFFRDPQRRPQLAELGSLLQQVRGAFDLLDLPRATELMQGCEQVINRLARERRAPTVLDMERVADGLSSLDLYVQELEHPESDRDRLLVDALSRFSQREDGPLDSVRGAQTSSQSLEAEIRMARGRIERLGRAWEHRHDDARVLRALDSELESLARDAEVVGDATLAAAAVAALDALHDGSVTAAGRALQALTGADGHAARRPSAETARLLNAGDAVIERELFRVYLREARDVLAGVATALDACRDDSRSREALATIRRCFHTLKGSGRMVRLDDLADAAFRVEQVLNHWLQEELAPTPALIGFLSEARRRFKDWVNQLDRHGDVQVDTAALAARGTALIANSRGASTAESAASAGAGPVSDTVADIGGSLPDDLLRIYLDEASGHLETLDRAFASGSFTAGAAREEVQRAAHTLAGTSRTAGYPGVAAAAAALERWLASAALAPGPSVPGMDQAGHALALLSGALEDIRAGVPPRDGTAVTQALDDANTALARQIARDGAAARSRAAAAGRGDPAAGGEELRDDIDLGLLPLFLEEADDLIAVIGEEIRQWRRAPDNERIPEALRRTLHTLKGSARLVGAMRFGDVVHRTEEQLGSAIAAREFPPHLLDELEERVDAMGTLLQAIAGSSSAEPVMDAPLPAPLRASPPVPAMRVSAQVLDGLVSRAGEVSIARGHVEAQVLGVRELMAELGDTVSRLRAQLREMEIHAEIATPAHVVAGSGAASEFDPLEFDRYTRLQELVRLMAESTADVVTVHSGLRRTLDHAMTALRSQARSGRDLQDSLMSVRTVAFNTVVDRLYRVLRQSCRELAKKTRCEIVGQNVELDRGVLEKVVPALEHLLRNAVAHGIEPAARRRELGKNETGEVRIEVRQEASEVVLEVADDGAGIDYERVRERALEQNLLQPGQADDQAALRRLIFNPGFTTATAVTELAGRGVGLDAVRSEVQSLGGWVEIESSAERGTRFRLHLPLTLVVMQALLVRSAGSAYAFPTHMVEHVQRLDAPALSEAFKRGHLTWSGQRYACHYLSRLLGDPGEVEPNELRNPVVLLRAGETRLALHVDETVRNHEAILRNLGPQIASIPGVIGASVLPSGEITAILNPIFLARFHDPLTRPAPVRASRRAPGAHEDSRPLVLVVDDSLTVRGLLEKLLNRNGYRVVTARDGVEAEQALGEFRPQVMLVDIEMPRMDGFELTRVVRNNPATADIPIIVITSRSADKHRAHALKLGADLFVGKPFIEEELLGHVAAFTGAGASSRSAAPAPAR